MASMQTFSSGATRSADDDKPDYEGFLSPRVIEAYGNYMALHRKQADGLLRDSDNWQKGMPLPKYMKSLWRHFLDLWKLHRGLPVSDLTDGHMVTKEEACCALLFNTMGYLHVLLAPVQTIVTQALSFKGKAVELPVSQYWTDKDPADEAPIVGWSEKRDK